jgi:hypothetical protein
MLNLRFIGRSFSLLCHFEFEKAQNLVARTKGIQIPYVTVSATKVTNVFDLIFKRNLSVNNV